MGAVFALFAGLYYWAGKITGANGFGKHGYSEIAGHLHFWTLFLGVKPRNIKNWRASDWAKPLSTRYSNKEKFICRSYSTIRCQVPEDILKTLKLPLFENVKNEKRKLYKTLKGTSGVYIFINRINNKLYIGSSLKMSRTLGVHFYHGNSLNKNETKNYLYRSMRLYGLEHFSLGILEFTTQDSYLLCSLEQKYLDLYKPKYNTLLIVGSSTGFKHSVDTINFLKEIFKKENHPKYGTTHSEETKKAISEGIKEFYRTHSHPSKGKKGLEVPQYGKGGIFVFCYNLHTGEEKIFPTLNSSKLFFKKRWTTLKKALDSGNSIILNNEPWVLKSTPRNT